jgi:hypothetical protein
MTTPNPYYNSNRCQTHFNDWTPYPLINPQYDKNMKEQKEKQDKIDKTFEEICNAKMSLNFKIEGGNTSVDIINKCIDEYVKSPIYELMKEYIKLYENRIFVIKLSNECINLYNICYRIVDKNHPNNNDFYYRGGTVFDPSHNNLIGDANNYMESWYSFIHDKITLFGFEERPNIGSKPNPKYIIRFAGLPPRYEGDEINYKFNRNKWMTEYYNYYAKAFLLHEENRLKQIQIDEEEMNKKKIMDDLILIDFSKKEVKVQPVLIETNMKIDIYEEPIININKIINEEPIINDKSKTKRRNIPQQIRLEVWIKYNGDTHYGKCYCCKKEISSGSAWHAGHVIAAENGGNDTAENLRPICPACNLAMGTENLYHFMKRCYPQNLKT